MSSRSCHYDYFELADGRFWSTAGASFVDPCAVMANATRRVVFGDLHLAKILREEGYPLGEYEGYEPAAQDVLAMRGMLLDEASRMEAKIAEYRAALDAVPDQPGFPARVEWPRRPW